MSSNVREDILLFLEEPSAFAAGVDDAQSAAWLSGLVDFAEPALSSLGKLSLRPAQVAAWRGLADQRAGLILGPPGTGKTFLEAWLAAGYIWARRRAGFPCRVLVTGFTRESMGNLVDQIALILSEHLPGVPAAFMGNLPDSDVRPGVRRLWLKSRDDKKAACEFLTDNPHLVVAATNWSLGKLFRDGDCLHADGHTARVFDLVLVDEASQILVSQGLMSLSGLAEGGRVVVAGDDRQLAPVRPTFEARVEGGRALGSSLYTFLKSSGVREFALEETFRLNDPLVTFPREHIYGHNYISAVPERRLDLRPGWREGLEAWQSVALDPEYPVVVLIHDGPLAGTENPFERHHIRRLVALLTESMLPAKGKAELDPQALWGDRLAVVTPHRAQNAALREELRPLPLCEAPYVDTVDRIQGRERDAIIAGYTVSDPEFAGQIANFIYSSERLNVTVTRPRSKLILLVSRRLLEVIPRDGDVFDDAQLLREYLYECELVSRFELSGPDGVAHPVELRARRFTGAAAGAGTELAGSRIVEGDPPVRVVELRYAGEELTDAQIMRELNLTRSPYTYIVATSALGRLRRSLCPPQQFVEGEAVMRFDEVVRSVLPAPTLTRTEERLYLQRAIQAAFSDPQTARQVRHDLFPWRDALAELARQGIDLTSGVPAELRERFVSDSVADVLARLQSAVREARGLVHRKSFEEAAHDFLATPFPITPVVVMEGFTYLTPLQRRFVESCVSRGSTVYFIYPYADEQRRGFSIMDRTYGQYDGVSVRRQLPAAPLPERPSALQFLRRSLFADVPPAPGITGADGSVTISEYSHRHDEIAACVGQIQEYIRTNQHTADEIVIVTRHLSEFDSLLQEHARLLDVPTLLSLPPRMLLLTPLGRFALTLYVIGREGQFRMTPAQFETILASGWLGMVVQETADTFNAVRPQMFERCTTREDWRTAFDQLQLAINQPAESRLPVAVVTRPILRRWRESLNLVVALCARLFAGPDRSIGQRIQQLLDELSRLDPAGIREAEREVIEKIREALNQVADVDGMEVSADEFGDVLNGLVREYQQTAEAGSETPEEGKVWVTTPEGLDSFVPGQNTSARLKPKKVVFYLGVDDQRVPRRASEPWPFFEDNTDENQERERYLFLAVVRAAGTRLHLSYALRGEGSTYQQSPYCYEVAQVLDLPPAGADAPRPADVTAPQVRITQARQVKRDEYSLHEVAQFGLCPYRYELERLDENARVCRDPFQIGLEAQSTWVDKVFERVKGQQASGQGAVEQLLLDAMRATEDEIRAMFGAFRDFQHWRTVRDHVWRTLHHEAKYLSDFGFPVRFDDAPTHVGYEIEVGARRVWVDCGLRQVAYTGRYPRPLLQPLTYREWLLPEMREDDRSGPPREQHEGLNLFTSLYHAVQWWSSATRDALRETPPGGAPGGRETRSQEVAELISEIEAGRYPKHPGGHCRVCPVKALCLGVPED